MGLPSRAASAALAILPEKEPATMDMIPSTPASQPRAGGGELGGEDEAAAEATASKRAAKDVGGPEGIDPEAPAAWRLNTEAWGDGEIL